VQLDAPERLLRHVELVAEAGEVVLAEFARRNVKLDATLVRVGIVLHDAGKIHHPTELAAPGSEHEPAGEALLLAHGVSPEVARICRSHARWASMEASLEELLVALADKLWKGVRVEELEGRVVDEVAARLGEGRWDVFIRLDSCFETIAATGHERLERSR